MNGLPEGGSSLTLLDISPDAIVIVDRGWRVRFANRAAADRTDAPREALHGRVLWEALPVLADESIALRLEPTFTAAAVVRWMTRAGDSYEVHGAPTPGGATLLFRDVTALRSAQGSLQEIARRIRAQFEAVPVPTYAWQLKGDDLVLVDYNAAAAEATGGRILHRLGESAESFYADDPAMVAKLRAMLEREAPLREEIDYRFRTTGELRRLVITLVRADADLVLVHAMDVTDQRRTDAVVRLWREQQVALLNNIPDHAWLKDADSRYIAVNEALASWLGISPEAFVGRGDADFYPTMEAQRFREQDQLVLRTGERQVSEDVSVHPEHGMRWFETIKTPYRDDSGHFAGTVGIARDITERKRIEEALRGSEEHLAAIVATQQEVVTAARDLDALTALVAERARQLTGADAATISHLDGDHVVCDHVCGDTTAGPGTSIPATGSLTGEALRLRTIVCATDTESDPRVDRALCQLLRVRSMIVAPLVFEGAPVRLLMVASAAPRRFGEREVRTLELLAGLLAAAIARAADFGAKQRLVAERTAALEALGQSERWFRSLIENAADPIAIVDPDGLLKYASPACQRVLGHVPDRMVGENALALVHPEDAALRAEQLSLLLSEPRATRSTLARVRHADGSYRIVEVTASNLLDDPVVGGFVVNLRDVDQQMRLEEQLRQAQKMEAVGQLAGGVAHDFNNLLTIIKCHTQFLRDDIGENHPHAEDLREIEQASTRATTLTRQLLAFSRKQLLKPRLLDLNAVVSALTPMMRRLIGEDIRIAIRLETSGLVLADPGQVEQVLLNLAVNARDAMANGGQLTISTEDVVLTPSTARDWLGAEPGTYVVLSVADTGCGMDAETKARAFEPFFTTKEPGKGTGLGLATVYGIVKQSGGYLWVESTPGAGSTFRIFLRRAEGSVEASAAPAEEQSASGRETVLVVEDEDGVRAIARRVLRDQGYTVMEASNGREALQLLAQHGSTIELVLTDVVMPEMNGHQLAQEVGRLCPSAKILYMTGYTDDEVARRGLTDGSAVVVEKPFSAARLTQTVRRVLDEG